MDLTERMSTILAYKPPEPGLHDPSIPTKTEIHFHANSFSERHPHIKELIKYVNDGSEGYLHFDGYYYVYDGSEDEYTKSRSEYAENLLPKRLLMDVIVQETEPYHVFCGGSWFRTVSHEQYEVEFYRREKLNCTDVISEIEDDDGEPMHVCFFPTDEQKLYFRVIKKSE
jgi:hypothetical protein